MGKAKLSTTSIDLLKGFKDNEKRQAGRVRADFSGVTTITKSIGAQSGSAAGNQTNFSSSGLSTSGGTMVGPIAFFGIAVTISTGVIDVGVATSTHTSNLIVTGEGGVADDLDTISNPSHSGQLLYLQSHTSTAITLKHGTGNIWMHSATDYVMTVGEIVTLLWDEVNSRWVLIATGAAVSGDNLGNHIATQDLDMGTSDITNVTDIGSSLFAMSDLWVNRIRLRTGVAGTNFPTITATAPTGDMEINVPDTKSIFLEHNGVVKHTFTKTAFTTLGTLTTGGTGAFGTWFSSSSGNLTSTSTLTTLTSTGGINLTVSGSSNDINLTASGNSGRVNISATGATSSGVIDLNATNYINLDATEVRMTGKLVYGSDPTNTYIDLVTGSGDIEIRTAGASDSIDILASGTGSSVNIESTQSAIVLTTVSTSSISLKNTSGFTGISTNGIDVTLGSGSGTITVQDDLDIAVGARVDFGSTSGTVGALVGYLNVKVAGTARKIPYYAV